ncbi:zinc finger protein zas1 [Biscogniauxia mediterranea]|nr:zinc finger protein zas1 [Biscogniauxia mediterranea]
MASQPQQSSGPPATSYKRASRKGAAKKFACNWPSCGKVYSRAEHLQRHQLNHSPKEIYRCDVIDCTQMFVRPDLLARHKKRHSDSYVPRNRTSSFSVPSKKSSQNIQAMPSSGVVNNNGQPAETTAAAPPPPQQQHQSLPPLSQAGTTAPPPPPGFAQQPTSAPRNASVLLTSDSPVQAQPSPMSVSQPSPLTHSTTPWPPSSMDGMNMIRQKPGFYSRDQGSGIHDHSTFVPFPNVQVRGDPNDMGGDNNFAMWLFDPQRSFADFSVANISFLEGGLESPFNNNIHYDHESLTSRSNVDLTPPRHPDMPDELISEYRRQEVLRWIQTSHQKQTKYDSRLDSFMVDSGGDMPGLSLEFLRDCIRHYWDFVSPRLPIVHQPTFSSSRCSIFLLLVIIALGAAQLHTQSMAGDREEYRCLADLIITHVRWDILTTDEASPPVDLAVAQALLLLEFYEKMFSSRKLHERAHIYHPATLTLLRRGSPLIGRSGSESPPEEQQQNGVEHTAASDARTWWIRWAQTESMHRVVFAAFMMDVIHAAMFGHTADMAPHEIRLPLPCDDSLWSASSPELVRQQEANFRMYGIKPVSFLDGLKHAIHGKEVKTHALGRMIIMCGLLSVGWHLRRRETHLKWLEMTSNSSDTRDKWCGMLLRAFDEWKSSFDRAIRPNDAETDGSGQQPGSSGLIQSASVLYHLAHISLYIDIVDCQVYAGAKRLLGRKVSTRDYKNVDSRMTLWADQPVTRKAILHAFRLLHRILIDPRQKRSVPVPNRVGSMYGIQYSTRCDTDPHRPWIMYYATLSIWSFVRALESRRQPNMVRPYSPATHRNPNIVIDYLTRVANLHSLDDPASANLREGLPELLDVVGALSSDSHSELLQEAFDRLEVCKEMLQSGTP